MMIAPSPTLQSWAMWLMAMTRQPAPTSVHPSARVARWIVTYSRTTVLAPILTPEGVPSLNFKSCGRPPRMEPWPIFTAGEARLRGDDSAVTDREMVGDAHLAGEHDTPADPARPGDPHLGDDDRVLADLDVVTDLHEVVDLGPAADDRLPQGGTVDGRVGADLDVVLDHHGADLRDLPVRFAVEGVAEAVGADHRARVDHDALAEPHPGADGHARVHDRRLADLGARPDERQRTDPDVGPDDGARP